MVLFTKVTGMMVLAMAMVCSLLQPARVLKAHTAKTSATGLVFILTPMVIERQQGGTDRSSFFCEKRVGDLDAITEKAREAMKIAKAVATAIEASEPEPPTPAVDLGSAKEPVEPETPLEPFEDERLDVFHASLSSALRAEKPMKVVEKTKQAAPTEGARATLEGKWRGEVYYPSTGTSVDVTLFFAKDKEGRLLGRADIPYYDVNNGTLNVTAEDPENGYTRFGLIVDDEGAAITFECYLQGIAKVSGNVACKGAAFADDTHGQFKATKTGEVDGVRARFGRSAANKEAFFPLFYELINVTNPSIAVSIPAFILTVTSGILPMVFLLFMARALNSGIRGSNAFDLTAAGYYAAYGVLIGVIYGVVLFARDSLIGLLGEKVSERLRARAFLSLANADIQFVEEVGAAALTSKIEKSSDAVKGSFVESTFVIIRNFVAIFTGVVGGLLMGWQIALVAIAVAVIFGLFLGLLMRHRNRHAGVISRWSWLGNVSMARDLTAARGIMELERRMIFESLDAVRSVHYTNNALSERSRFLHAASERARKSIMISLVDGFFDALTFTVLLLGLAGVVYYASYIVSSVTQITYAGTSVFIIVSMFYSVMAAMDLSKAVIAAKRGFRPATDLFRLLERVATEPQTGEDIHNVDGNISFDSCVFGVKATSPISFSVPEKTLTVVLPTAANTHTSYGNYFAQSIAAVLMRVADPLIGRIRVDKKAIDSVSPHSLRKFVAVIDANPRIFTATIEYNIRYAKPQGTKEEVREALRVSGLANIVRNMPQGLETVVGQTPLSLAMRRKIAIARAYLQNPAIVIIDDLTLFGGMSEGELEVEYALAELVKGRTAICFTPSPILVKKANEILIMDETGLVSDRGSFSQLCNVNKEFNSIYGEEEE
uniref:Uncharacterized protein n=1 Tax=Palpitomonas bilix TaxID=652834 RepID=A0A7S3LX90_9EUKA|mmetsp:Transcript_7268/g.18884  ORF Transcript_7268/g.18884 Transcript_7268/m.18884 type:complete len:888 (+) Transcript_7268:455-3118(+)